MPIQLLDVPARLDCDLSQKLLRPLSRRWSHALRWLLLKAGLPMPDVQKDLHDSDGDFVGRADLFYPGAHLVLEFDGGNHRDRLVTDNRRQNGLVQAGYRILRFTSADLRGRPEAVVAQVRHAITGPR